LTLKEAERALNDARSTADRFGSFPKRDREELVRRLKAVQSLLMPRVKELREMHEWAQWANVGVQEELIARVEALKSLDDLDKAAAHLRDIQARWKLASDVPKERSQALWLRFKTAHDEIWARCEAYFAAQAAERMGNLRLKEAVCERAESLADSTDWLRTAEEIKRLQAEWKTIGPVPRGQEKAVWERFRKACDRFFTRRHEDLARRKEQWAKNLAHKEALCAQAEALADSTDWESAAAQLRKLQTEWKTIGPVKKTRSEAIWQRFRTACDRFFERYGQRDRIARQAHMAEREELCQQLEALLSTPPDDGPQLLLERVQDIRRRWLHATPLLPGEAKSWNDRFRAALSRIIEARAEVFRSTDLDPEANRRKMETLCERVEGLVHAIAPAEAAASPAARLAAMWREALASNTIGGKVDEEAKWRAAGDEIRQAKAAFDRIGFVPPELDRVLSDRFERACRRFFAYRDQRRRQVPAVIRGS
jgi:hypothetical protein